MNLNLRVLNLTAEKAPTSATRPTTPAWQAKAAGLPLLSMQSLGPTAFVSMTCIDCCVNCCGKQARELGV